MSFSPTSSTASPHSRTRSTALPPRARPLALRHRRADAEQERPAQCLKRARITGPLAQLRARLDRDRAAAVPRGGDEGRVAEEVARVTVHGSAWCSVAKDRQPRVVRARSLRIRLARPEGTTRTRRVPANEARQVEWRRDESTGRPRKGRTDHFEIIALGRVPGHG